MWKWTVLAFFLVFGVVTFVQGQATGPGGSNPCVVDVHQFCPDVNGRGPILRCLHSHTSSLSPACKEFMHERTSKLRAEAKACRGDVETLCRGVEPRGGRIVACLRQHEAELSPGCKAEIPEN
jgi:Cysteine rich repeat